MSLADLRAELESKIAPTQADKLRLDDTTSPQGRALTWLEADTITQTCGRSTQTVLERYVLAVLFISSNIWSSPLPSKSDSVCAWNEITVDCDGTSSLVGLNAYCSYDLEGTIPWELKLLTDLRSIIFHGNSLSGTIPERITEMTKLTHLDIGYNGDLSGTIPSSIGALTQLTYLDLFYSDLVGTIPASIGALTRLTYLHLDENDLTGSIPSSIGALTQLTDVDLSQNKLSGSIPDEMGALTELVLLWLNNNQFTGTVPASLYALPKMTDLRV